ncbi:hypothetical protein HW132_02220 [Brasilonema sp. CT11]|nr:hypothetical protein [Brasilonema sp. CT11]
MKTVSRRNWSDAHANKWLNAYRSGRHLHSCWSNAPFVPGAYYLGQIHLSCEPYPEMLIDMPELDLVREGGFWRSHEDFIRDIGKGDPYKTLWVVRWDKFLLAC